MARRNPNLRTIGLSTGAVVLLAVAAGWLVLRSVSGATAATVAIAKRLQRARSAIGHGIGYDMGHGGEHPEDALPTRDGLCDCSAFIAWVLGIKLSYTLSDRWWGVQTDSIYADATGPQKHFQRLAAPVAGCLAVYPDHDGLQGHVALVTDPAKHLVVDCSSKADGITEHVQNVFWNGSEPTVWCMPTKF